MSIGLSLSELMEYTDWERGTWREWLERSGDAVLATSLGPHGDGRFAVLGDVVRHIFSAELRYVERLEGRPLTDPATLPNDRVEPLFRFGERSRASLRAFVAAFPAARWDEPLELEMMGQRLRLTPRKIVVHVQLHELRHWAQLATLLRLGGRTVGFHDFLFSPALGGDPRQPGG